MRRPPHRFADWGVDFVKYDAGCQDDASLHDGTLLESIARMRDGLNATNRTMIFYVGAFIATAHVDSSSCCEVMVLGG